MKESRGWGSKENLLRLRSAVTFALPRNLSSRRSGNCPITSVELKRIFAFGIAVALVSFAAGLLMWLNRGPRYEGKPADYWVEQLLHDNLKARQALRTMGPAAVPALADAVSRRRGAFWFRFRAWLPKLPPFLARRLPSPALDQLLQERAIEVLYELGPAAAPAVPALVGVDASLNDFVGFGSAGLAHATLLQIGPAGLPYLLKILKSKDPKLRARAASYIGNLGPQAGAAGRALAKALSDSNPAVRNSAVIALAQIGPPARAGLPQLNAALRLGDDDFRLQVIHALWKVGRQSETIVPLLIATLSDRTNPNRAGAAMLLGEMGPAARAAAPALTNVLREEFSYTRVKAEEALKQIHREPGAKADHGPE